MKAGDLVKKVEGFGGDAEFPLVGIVVEVYPNEFRVKVGKKTITKDKVLVLTEGGFEKWIAQFVEILK